MIDAKTLIRLAVLTLVQACAVWGPDDPGIASVSGSVSFTGGGFGIPGPVVIPVIGASVSAQGQTATTNSEGYFLLTGLSTGPTDLTVSADGYADTTVKLSLANGANSLVITARPLAEIVLGDTARRMSGPGVVRTSMFYRIKTGYLDPDPMPTFTTTGPFTAERGGQSSRDRFVKITATGPGSGSVTVSYEGRSATVAVEARSLKFKTINIGTGSACGIALDDTAWCWGGNYGGQLGASTPSQCNGGACQYGGREGNETPLPVSGEMHFTQVATAGFACANFGLTQICGTSCALTTNGRPWCWGGTPKQMAAVSLKQLSLRSVTFSGSGGMPGSSLCGLAADGKAWCFSETTVTADGGGMTFQSYSAGRVHSCGVDFAGDVYCWGNNSSGALGIGTADAASHTAPEKVNAPVKFSSVSLGEHSTCALATTGTIYCWGVGFAAAQPAPQPLAGSRQYIAIARGERTVACGLTAAGEVDCWTGFSFQPSTAPVPALAMISVGNGPVSPYGGWGGLPYNACGLTADGTAYCWQGAIVTKIAQP